MQTSPICFVNVTYILSSDYDRVRLASFVGKGGYQEEEGGWWRGGGVGGGGGAKVIWELSSPDMEGEEGRQLGGLNEGTSEALSPILSIARRWSWRTVS